jgi:AcrR family transcriptional regulator
VVAAARELANEQGLDKLTMRALSARVGVEAPSLYTHVEDKEDLYDGLAELIFSEVEVEPSDDPWPRRIAMYSDALRSALLDNANLVAIAATRPIVSLSTLNLVEQALAELVDIGLTTDQAIYTLDTLVSFVIGHALTEVGTNPAIGGHSEEELAAQRAALPADLFPHVAKTLGRGPIDRDAEFSHGIQLLISGIAATLHR